MNRFPFMAGANAWERNRFSPMLMNFPFSSFGLLLSTGQGIRISLPYSNASPEGSNPVLQVGHQRLSLCYVQDIVQGILLAVETQTKSGEIFFLSDGNDYRMEEIGDIFAQAMGITALRIRVPRRMILGIACFSEYLSKLFGRPSLLNKDKAEEIVQKEWVCDITKAKTLLGFEPRVPLSEGARLTFEWYKKEKWL